MAEYIFGDRIIAQHKYGGVTVETVKMNAERRERIVRCRDCKFCEDDYCALLEFSDGRMDDGFCKWGEESGS